MKSDVLALVASFSNGQADPNQASIFYDQVVQDYATMPILTQASLITVTANTSQYAIPSTAIKLIAAFYDDRWLDRLTLRAAESVSPQWRDQIGTPIAYVVEGETTKTLRLYPNPQLNSKNFVPVFGSPFGLDYPPYSAVVVHTETRQDLPAWLELPCCFEVLRREFTRESNHRDIAFATLCGKMTGALLSMVA